jgi:hypothetical protein
VATVADMPKGPQDYKEVVMSDISNRQIFIDTVVSVFTWIAVVIPLSVILWWVDGFLPIPDRWRPSFTGLAGVGAVLILRFIKWGRNIPKS